MEVVDKTAALLCEYDVWCLLEERRHDDRGGERGAASATAAALARTRGKESVRTIVYEVRQYLSERPCSVQSAASITAFLEAIAAFELTKAEKLQILNMRPKSLVDVHMLIEACDVRFTDEQCQDMLRIAGETLPAPVSASQPSDEQAPTDGAGV